MRNAKEARVGDTLHLVKQPVEPLPGFQAAKSMVRKAGQRQDAGAVAWY